MYVINIIVKYVCSYFVIKLVIMYFVTNGFSFACYNVRSCFVTKCAVNQD